MSRLGVEVVWGGGCFEGLGELVEDVSFNERVRGWNGVWVIRIFLKWGSS